MRRALALAVGLCLAAGSAWSSEPLRIGLMAPLTGSWASEGQEMKRILDLLAKGVNDRGGLLGRQVEIVAEDDGGDPRTASLAAQRLSTRGVVAVVGTYGSSITEASQTILDEAEIVQIANGSTAVRLTEKGLKYFLRTCPRDDEQGRVAAQTLRARGFSKVAILHDNTSYSKGLAEEARGLLGQAGAAVVFFDAITPGERDYTAVLTRLKTAGPDAVFFTGYYPEAGLLLRQKKEMGWGVPFLGGDATNNPDLVKIAGTAAAEGFLFLSPPVPQDLPFERAKEFLSSYRAAYGSAPGSIWAVLAGDGFLSVVAGIEGAKSTEAAAVAAYLKNDLKDFSGLTGTIAFDEKGDRVGEVYKVYRVDASGGFVLQP
ncbi:MAG: branched-chain amino acid ABC transporter substrate-binding protein [Deferrisomatales bacterium]|nr:branched-chain amino acid ABC transporter substrate-binding protein [Deferrisomatales bacterium]